MAFKNTIISKTFKYLSFKRKKEFFLLLISIVLSGFLEAFAIVSAVPFLSLLTSPELLFKFSIIKNLSKSFNIYDPTQLLLPSAIFFCLLILSTAAIRLFNIWFILYFSAKVEIELSNLIFKRNLYLNYEEYTKKSSSETISLLVEKVAGASSGITAFLKILANSVIIIAITIALTIFNWKISFSSLLVLFLYYFYTSKKVKNRLVKNGESIAHLNTERIRIVQEGIGSFRDLTINNTQKIYLNIFNRNQEKLKFTRLNSEFIRSYPRFIIESLVLIMIIIYGYILSKRTSDFSFITLLGTFAFGAQRLLPIIQQLYVSWSIYKSSLAEFNYVFKELIHSKSKIFYQSFHKKNKFSFNFLEFHKVDFAYASSNSSSKVLDGINIKIYKGDYIGIHGKTGSGKSTFLDILMGLLNPDKGNFYVNNLDLNDTNLIQAWRNQIAHVPQNIFLKEGTIEDNICFVEDGSNVNRLMLTNAAKVAEIFNFVKNSKLGFKTIVGERGIKLSGGQRQRIAIARAIYRRKKILILDEATSALDENTEQSILNKIRTLYNDLTIIMVTHRLKSLESCDRVFRIDKGSLIEEV